MKEAEKQIESFRKLADTFGKQVGKTIDFATKKFGPKASKLWKKDWEALKYQESLALLLRELEQSAHKFGYFRKELHWLLSRFPDARYTDVPGLCKIVSKADIEAADWSLTPGRYVGVAPLVVDEDFDFGESITEIHKELAELNVKAGKLAKLIERNFEDLGV